MTIMAALIAMPVPNPDDSWASLMATMGNGKHS